jgi:CBS domain-containing protein
MTVNDILNAKGRKVVSVPPHTHVRVAAQRMRLENIAAIMVSSDGGRTIAGILSEHDIVHGLVDHHGDVLDLAVAELMSRAVVTCAPSDSVASVMRTMTQRRFRHLPVVEDGTVVGLISIGDVVKDRIDTMELETSVLRDYIVAHN